MFEKIETEKDAYFLGILLSDGCVSVTKNGSKVITLELHNGDRDVIYKFVDYLGISNKIQEKEKSTSITFGSKETFDNLQRYNCVPRKSLILEFPKNVNHTLYNHLIRGYFDGDGCISKIKYKRKSRANNSNSISERNKWTVDFVGTYEFLESVSKIIGIGNSLYKVNKNNDKNTYRLCYSNNKRVSYVLEFMYSSATVYMNRKFEKYLEFLKQ